jgi:hypothetical protein
MIRTPPIPPTHGVIPAKAGISVYGASGLRTAGKSRATPGPTIRITSCSVNRESRFRGNDPVEGRVLFGRRSILERALRAHACADTSQ